MLATSKYSREYIDDCRSRIELQLSTYRNMIAKARHLDKSNDRSLHHTIEAFERPFLNNMILLLDAMFVHRTRTIEGKDGNALHEVRLLCNSILNNNQKMVNESVIKSDKITSILRYNNEDDIRLSITDFEKLYKGFFAEIEKKYLE
jgi:hypothetical protein